MRVERVVPRRLTAEHEVVQAAEQSQRQVPRRLRSRISPTTGSSANRRHNSAYNGELDCAMLRLLGEDLALRGELSLACQLLRA